MFPNPLCLFVTKAAASHTASRLYTGKWPAKETEKQNHRVTSAKNRLLPFFRGLVSYLPSMPALRAHTKKRIPFSHFSAMFGSE